MTKYRSKARLIEAIQVEHLRLEKTIAHLTEENMVKSGAVGTWSVKDVLAHLTAWEQFLLNWYDAGLHGKSTSPPPVGMSKNAINALNQDIFEQNRRRLLSTVVSEFQASYLQVLELVQVVQEEDMFKPSTYAWTGRYTFADYIAGNTCNHYLWAKTKIHIWMKAGM